MTILEITKLNPRLADAINTTYWIIYALGRALCLTSLVAILFQHKELGVAMLGVCLILLLLYMIMHIVFANVQMPAKIERKLIQF